MLIQFMTVVGLISVHGPVGERSLPARQTAQGPARFYGTWKAFTIERAGKRQPPKHSIWGVQITKDRFVLLRPKGRHVEYACQLHLDRQPVQLDLNSRTGTALNKAIVEVRGDVLWLGLSNDSAPQDFDTTGKDHVLILLQRSP